MRALVVDPGKMTGFGILEWGTDPRTQFHSAGELPMDEFLDTKAFGWVMGSKDMPVDLVVCESFDVRADTSQKVAGGPMWSSEQIGVLRLWCRWNGTPFVLQTPSDMKSFDKDKAKTKILGWWQDRNPAEKGHRRDAASHALLYAARHNLIDSRMFL